MLRFLLTVEQYVECLRRCYAKKKLYNYNGCYQKQDEKNASILITR